VSALRPDGARVEERPVDGVQRRTISTLVATQMLGGLGVGAAISVNALLAKTVSGSEQLAGLAQTFAVLGAAVITLLLARIMDRDGRRPGLSLGYAIGVGGAAISIVAGVLGAFPLLLVGATMLGGTTAANNQSRYAATDLSHPAHRGRDLSLVVWATTVGSVIGPNLTGPGKAVAAVVGIPALTGAYVIAGIGMLAAMAVMVTRLRPDPLLLARARHTEQEPLAAGSPPPVRASGWALLRENRMLRLAAIGLALCHAVMVSVMVMTPLHMDHGHAELEIIGLVISIHILGMFVFSPLVGMAVDRWGSGMILLAGGVTLLVSLVLAGTSQPGSSWSLGVGLFLLGVGWSLGTIACSTLVTAAATPTTRPAIQGVTDLITGVTAAVGGALAGVIVATRGYATLNLLAGLLVLGVLAAAVAVRTARAARDGDRS
jgi:MFS family permease